MSKLFTALLNHRPSSFLEVNNLLGEEQSGFRSGYATTDHSLALHFIIEHLLTKRGRVNGKQCKISSMLYRMLKVADDQGTHTSKWMTFVQDNLNKAGLGYLWNQEQFNPNWFKHRGIQ